MAKELMEIGGFITEGAEFVNHDNTLSGNGTVDSPLGVVPGYNETVLWEGNKTSAITASEPFTNFEKVDLYIAHSNYGPGQIVNLDFNSMGNTGYFAICRPRGTNALNAAYIRFSASNLTNEIHTTNSKCLAFGAWSNTNSTPAATVNEAEDLNSIYKVVGINRKAQ